MRGPWKKRDLVATIDLDTPDLQLRVYRKTWEDGSQCIDLQKWIKRDNGSWSMYRPCQYLQLTTGCAGRVLEELAYLFTPLPKHCKCGAPLKASDTCPDTCEDCWERHERQQMEDVRRDENLPMIQPFTSHDPDEVAK